MVPLDLRAVVASGSSGFNLLLFLLSLLTGLVQQLTVCGGLPTYFFTVQIHVMRRICRPNLVIDLIAEEGKFFFSIR